MENLSAAMRREIDVELLPFGRLKKEDLLTAKKVLLEIAYVKLYIDSLHSHYYCQGLVGIKRGDFVLVWATVKWVKMFVFQSPERELCLFPHCLGL